MSVDPSPLKDAEDVNGRGAIVVEFILDAELEDPELYFDNPQEGRNSLYGPVHAVHTDSDVVSFFSENAPDPLDIDFEMDILVDAETGNVIGREIAVYDYDEVTGGDDPRIES